MSPGHPLFGLNARELQDIINDGVSSPVAVGQGTRLFPDTGPDIALELVDSRADSKGVAIQVYRPAGRPHYAPATAD